MTTSTKETDLSLIERVNSLVRRARLAAAVLTQYSQEDVDRIMKAMTIAALGSIEELAIAAHEETRMGLIEDKILKNFVASEFHYHQIKDKKTVGVIREFPEDNMVEVAEPMGVILALSPVTNPTSTIIFKAIAAIKTRNSIIFSPHLMAADSSNRTAKILYDAGIAAGAPKGFISWVEKSPRLRRETEMMFVHPEVDLIFATGGTQMVKAAYSSGKPALGVGPGNTPVYITSTATPKSACMDVVISKTFDNGTECPSEQTLIIDRAVADEVLQVFKQMNCYICTPEEVEKVAEVAIDQRTGGMNYRLVGQPADTVAQAAGIPAPQHTKMILCPLIGDLRYHKLSVEKLMPVLGYVIVDSVDEGINRALDINYAGGTGHTAGIYSEDDDVIERFAIAINAGRIIVNSPTSLGGLGGIYNNLNTTLSFGCGTGGGNITTDNVGIKNLLNYKRVPRRTNYTLAFQTTKNIYINPGSLDHLRGLKTKSAFLITSKSAAKRGHVSQVVERLPADCQVNIFNEIDVEPDYKIVQRVVQQMRQVQPDTIIALGGGSVLDAAKIIRLFYDHPDLKMSELSVKFLDFRHRVVTYPQKMTTPLVAIPTTSGTGSEVTPFAVLKDNEKNKKITLADEVLLPDTAIIDANLTKSLPKDITVDTAFDALTHALEALVSTYASDYTDGLALEALRLIFEALPETLKAPTNIVWRHKLHNASCLAGMAIGNASVGVNHGLAHALGATFNVPHGRANSVFLLATIELNSKIPRKFMPNSAYPLWVADEKYARAARFLGLKPEQDQNRNGSNDAPEASKEAMIQALRRAIYDLAITAGQAMSISELGIPRADFDRAIPQLIRLAGEDMSLRTNPSMPLISILLEMFTSSYAPRVRP